MLCALSGVLVDMAEQNMRRVLNSTVSLISDSRVFFKDVLFCMFQSVIDFQRDKSIIGAWKKRWKRSVNLHWVMFSQQPCKHMHDLVRRVVFLETGCKASNRSWEVSRGQASVMCISKNFASAMKQFQSCHFFYFAVSTALDSHGTCGQWSRLWTENSGSHPKCGGSFGHFQQRDSNFQHFSFLCRDAAKST